MAYVPLKDKLLVKRIERQDEVTKSGLIVVTANSKKQGLSKFEVLAVGPGTAESPTTDYKPGQVILVYDYQVYVITENQVEHTFLSAKDVFAIDQ